MPKPNIYDAVNLVDQSQAAIRTQLYLRAAYHLAAKHSDDPRTQNGAVIVKDSTIIAVGVNQFPKGVTVTPERLGRPAKYQFMEHAERNAIYALTAEYRENMSMYCPWYACTDCARAIIQTGIKKVVGHKQAFDKYGVGPWTESIAVANEMFDEAGVVREYYDGPIGGVSILFNGSEWTP